MTIPPEAWTLVGVAISAGPAYLTARRSRQRHDAATAASTDALSASTAATDRLADRLATVEAAVGDLREQVAEIRGRLTASPRPWGWRATEDRSAPAHNDPA